MATLLALADVRTTDCGRYRDAPELRNCELEREEHEILDAGVRPPMDRLGAEAIRFSSMPALGGRAGILEVVKQEDGGARAHILTFYGHPSLGWSRTGFRRFSLSGRAYRRFAAQVDAALAPHGPAVTADHRDSEGVIVVCTDGPGFLTERLIRRHVISLAGSCPRGRGERHGNAEIARAVYALVCARLGLPFAAQLDLGDGAARNRCSAGYRPSR